MINSTVPSILRSPLKSRSGRLISHGRRRENTGRPSGLAMMNFFMFKTPGVDIQRVLWRLVPSIPIGNHDSQRPSISGRGFAVSRFLSCIAPGLGSSKAWLLEIEGVSSARQSHRRRKRPKNVVPTIRLRRWHRARKLTLTNGNCWLTAKDRAQSIATRRNSTTCRIDC